MFYPLVSRVEEIAPSYLGQIVNEWKRKRNDG